MRAVVARGGAVGVEQVPDPQPGEGQVLVEPLACGICGSDIHFVENQATMPDVIPAISLGHEFVGRVIDYGPGTSRHQPVGSAVTSVPYLDTADGPLLVGLSPGIGGGLAEQMILQEKRLIPVPEGMDPVLAALTEPLAVGGHAVAAANMAPGDVALVVGCGPVGMAVIATLKASGHRPIVAADFSAGRRRLAEKIGADVIVDPAQTSPYNSWAELAGAPPLSSPLQETAQHPNTVVFECVGAPGVLQAVFDAVPLYTRVVVVGVCNGQDTITPMVATVKELSIRFVFAYRPEEFSQALRWIGDGTINAQDFVTATRTLDDVGEAFNDLRKPDEHCKILLLPGS
ncbi:zinc-binding dehydrogenase [Mycobacterium sp. 48b]|uniref:zinc-binding dehydrogenase n=1 Tax=Mycobacterium sp. 48b TaxID=3400426 RepID=UPI003AB06172